MIEIDEETDTWNEFDDNCARSDDVTNRLAICNMDWDRVRAVDLFFLLNSFKQDNGVIKSVTIYPSDLGLKQIEEETRLGPLSQPPTTNASVPNETHSNEQDSGHASEEEEGEEEEGEEHEDNGNEEDDAVDPIIREKLRKYQLNRLKYYYAVVECDTVNTASKLYEECDGLEYETSAVRLDLRFIPNDVRFDDMQPYDQCTSLPDSTSYKPRLFRNSALTQTKVHCTWDETPLDRRTIMRKKYTMEEIENMELDAYLASDSENEEGKEDEEEDNGDDSDAETQNNNFKIPAIPLETKIQSGVRAPSILSSQDDIERYRSLLLDFNDDTTATTIKKKKKTLTFDNNLEDDNDSTDGSDIDMEITWQPGLKEKSNTVKHQDKLKPSINKSLLSSSNEMNDKEHDALELLTIDDDKRDYNLRDMIKTYKQSTKNNKKNKKPQHEDDDFKLNVNDQRFQAIFDSYEYNIDPSDPQFKSTFGTQQFIDEKGKKRKLVPTTTINDGDTPVKKTKIIDSSSITENESDNNALVRKIKAKSKLLFDKNVKVKK
ncbi:unnamed protein product [Didymodactylos carnosus]|uniref:NUC153 domain-containing protein n=1 Tax=Didymodactylos carnosus TaxID=1234261 RepID=A0A8S2DJL1_9BILA|nr:unnamed protein product [Didymodactylos carnosus]CAF3756225.1 unnamed protein product [Didymodactylos carnosus]